MSPDLTSLMRDSTQDLSLPAGFTEDVLRGGRRRRLRRRTARIGTVALVLVGAATVPIFGGATPTRSTVQTGDGAMVPPTWRLQTFCLLPVGGRMSGPTDLIGPTGDPVENCARFWRHELKTEPPPLVAYQDRFGEVQVQARTEPVPDGSSELPAGVVQDPEAIELAEALGDPIGVGLERCRDRSEALSDAQRVVGGLGFADWPVVVDDTRTNSAVSQCWGFGPNPRTHVVTVSAFDGGFDYPAFIEEVAQPLRASLTQCWDRTRAISEVHAAVARSSLKDEFKQFMEIRVVDVPGAACTILRMGGGGGVQFTLRGPA